MGKEYLTIAEYAEIKGISKQAVYKQLNNKLKDYVEIVENKKRLKISVLEENIQPHSTKVEQPIQPISTKVEQPIQPISTEVEQPIQPISTEVEQPIQPFLEAQIKEKDKTIDSLLRQIEALQEQNTRLTELLHNSQVLLAVEKQALIQEQASTHTEEPEHRTETQSQDKPTEQKKHGFIYRLFGRNK